MKLKYILILLVLFVPFNINALDKVGTTSIDSRLRVGPSTTTEQVKMQNSNNVVAIKKGSEVTIYEEVDSQDPSKDGCSSKKWYKIQGKDMDDGKDYTGYICTSLVSVKNETEPTPDPTPEPTTPESSIIDSIKSYGTVRNANIYSTPTVSNVYDTVGDVTVVPIMGEEKGSGCDMYRVIYDSMIKFVCKNKVTNIKEAKIIDPNTITYNYDDEIKKFPADYRNYLNELHKIHPNWRFYAINTNLDFYEVIRNEQKQSYLNGRDIDQGYFITLEPKYYDWRNNTWASQDSGLWYVASKEAIMYYVDPRKYLNEREIFVFEDSKAYTYQNDSVLAKMIEYGGASALQTNYNGVSKSYFDAFKEVKSFAKASPLTVLARSRIETAKFTSGSVSGRSFYYNGKTYSGYYNYYNIGAWAHSGRGAIDNGLIYALNAGWNNSYKAIIEGASFIAAKYIYAGQETQYYQKFNVSPDAAFAKYGHQYQTNIDAPKVESGYVYWGYNDSGNIDMPIVFNIPVYNNMPNTLTVPRNGNPNNWLTGIKIDGKDIYNHIDGSGNNIFDGDLYYSYDNNWDGKADDTYTNNVIKHTVSYDTESINIEVTRAQNTTTVSNIGKVVIKDEVTEVNIISKAENGTTKTYKLVVTKAPRPNVDEHGEIIYPDINKALGKLSVKYNALYMYGLSLGTSYDAFKAALTKQDNRLDIKIEKNGNNNTSTFATGDAITITNGKDKVQFKYTLYGDLNGDAKINILDLIHIRNIMLDESNLAKEYQVAGDINHDGKTNILDLILVRNSILGDEIAQ